MVVVIKMNIINFLLGAILLLFPILLYLSSLIPLNDFSLERNKLYFSLSLFSSFLILAIYTNYQRQQLIFLFIPIVIAFILKRKSTAIYLEILLLIYFHNLEVSKFFIILGELVSFFIIYRLFFHKTNYKKKITICIVRL